VLTEEQYLTHVAEQDGYCLGCQEWTCLGQVDGFAENCLCPMCLKYKVCGAEHDQVLDALFEELLTPIA
jgi:hypothetical protein